MDILYVLGNGSKWGNNEIRYSLRSIEKFGKNVGNVYVIGSDPGFLSDNVTLVKLEDYHSTKQKNILNKICEAVEYTNIADEFLLSSDDHFYVKETDFDNYPIYCKGLLPVCVKKKDKAKAYKTSLVSTRRLLEKHGYTYYNFSQHGNTYVSKEAINLAKDCIEESYNTLQGVEPTCLLLNILYKHKPFDFINRKDLKVRDIVSGVKGLKTIIGDREVFSIYDEAIDKGVSEYLQELFPNKSKYEL